MRKRKIFKGNGQEQPKLPSSSNPKFCCFNFKLNNPPPSSKLVLLLTHSVAAALVFLNSKIICEDYISGWEHFKEAGDNIMLGKKL